MVTSANKIILSSGKFSGTTRAELAQAFEAFRSSGQKDRLVLHFHGGLVPQVDAEAIADRLLPFYRDTGLGYPIFSIWQAGLWEVLRNNWREIVTQDLFERLVARVLQFVEGKLDQSPGEKGGTLDTPTILETRARMQEARVGKEPLREREAEAASIDPEISKAEAAQFETLVKSDAGLIHAANRFADQNEPAEVAPDLRQDIEKSKSTADPNTRAIAEIGMIVAAAFRILRRCLRRFADSRDHGIYTTVVEEVAREIKGDLIGGIIWKHMKKDTADTFDGPAESFGGSATLAEIGKLHASGLRPRLTLIGHSTGAVYICQMLQAAKALLPDAKFEVVFLAPACTFRLLDQTLTVAGDRISQFRSFGMEDEVEVGDQMFAPFYLRSLLYFVSGLVEEEADMPLVGMKRYHSGVGPYGNGAFGEIARVRRNFKGIPNAWVWSKSSLGPGLNTHSLKHGDFDNDTETLASIAHILSKGFA